MVILLAALLASPAAMSAAAPAEELDQLDEVRVSAIRIKPTRDMQQIIDWLARLVGQFQYDGSVELRAGPGVPQGQLLVSGVGDCVGFGLAPGVQCAVKVRWPEVRGADGEKLAGSVSNLNPAMILYGLDPDRRGIHFLQVDKYGIAEGGLGYLDGNTLVTSAPCEAIPGDCKRITRVTAQPDGKQIQMQVDIEQEGRRTVRYKFYMRRLSRALPED